MVRRQYVWFALLAILYVGIMGAGGCGRDARQAIDSAEQAMNEAKEAEAPQYAPDEYRSAEESLLAAQREYDGLRYDRAETSARTAETQAKLALEKALEEKARSSDEERRREEEEAAEALAYNVSSLYGETAALEAPSVEEEARMALHDVHFPYDSSELSNSAQGVLALNAQWLKDHANIRVEIEGHCDERGDEEYNLALGAKRAKVVFDYMVSQGVPPANMQTISYGESVPLDPGHTEDAWAKNRRSHFAVIQ